MGLFNSLNAVHQDFVRFCFMSILRNELYRVAEMRNQHLIGSIKFGDSSGPKGRPDCIFFLPHLFDSEDYKVPVDPDENDEFI